jgi:hypothetical protein
LLDDGRLQKILRGLRIPSLCGACATTGYLIARVG